MINEELYKDFNPSNQLILGYVSELITSKTEGEMHAKIIPVSVWQNDQWLSVTSDTVKSFPYYFGEYVFAYNFTKSFKDAKKYSFFEFHVREADQNKGASYTVDYDNKVKPISLPYVFNFSSPKLISQIKNGYFDPGSFFSEIDELDENTRCYLCIEDKTDYLLIGKFKNVIYGGNGFKFFPLHGKEVYLKKIPKDQLDNDSIKFSQARSCLLNDTEFDMFEKTPIDAMTSKQLEEWAKGLINGLDSVDLKSIRNTLKLLEQNEINDPLAVVRQKRVFDNYDWIELVFKTSEKQKKDLLDTYVLNHPEIRKEIEEKVLEELSDLETNKNEIRVDIDSATTELELLKKEIEDKTNERSSLSSEINDKRTDLEKTLETLRIQQRDLQDTINEYYRRIEISENRLKDNSELKYFPILEMGRDTFAKFCEEQEYETPLEVGLTRNAKILNCNEEMKTGLLKDNVFINCRAIFVPNISWAYAFGKIVGNANIASIYPEYDWLHYDDFKNAGLEKIWMDATLNPSCMYILYIDGINIVAPESGLRSLLDVIAGKSLTLANTGLSYPQNLKVLASVLPTVADNPDERLGVRLRKIVFEKWGAISDPNDLSVFNNIENDSSKLLSFYPSDFVIEQNMENEESWILKKEKYFDF